MRSKIEDAMNLLRSRILSEFDDLIKKHITRYDLLKAENDKLKKTIFDAADIIHNIPLIHEPPEAEKELKVAWKILDKSGI